MEQKNFRRRPRHTTKKLDQSEFVSPLDVVHKGAQEEEAKARKAPADHKGIRKKARGFFITGTDTNVGKTLVTYVLGMLLKESKWDVGVMKPVQCGGSDAKFLAHAMNVNDDMDMVNPYYAPNPYAPNVAFRHLNLEVNKEKIFEAYQYLRARHDILLMEGAGGLMVPLTDNYLVADLIRDLNLELIIVARLGLGTINHTLLTIHQARHMGLRLKGVIFNSPNKTKHGVPERTNPEIISRLGNVTILGSVPFLNVSDPKEVLNLCRKEIHLNLLLENENKKNETRVKELAEWDKQYLWHPFTQMKDWLNEEPLIINEGRGSFLRDMSGRKYLDGVSSLWVNVHGHRKREIDEAVRSQINKVSHSTLLGLSNPPAIELGKKLVEIAPKGLQKVFYSDNGSTAVEAAIKMAYQFWQNTGKTEKTRIAHLSHSYHGDTLGSVSVGGIDLFHKAYSDITFKAFHIGFPDFYRCPRGKSYPQYTDECIKDMEQVIKRMSKDIACLVAEPIVQGAAGMIVWPEGVLKSIRDICSKYDILLILDEVATGFGRTGKMFACEHEGVIPDILCLAKGLTGGYLPLAATLTTQKIFDGFLFDYKDQKTFFHGHTYTGNPLACAAALANIEIFEREKVLESLQPKIAYLTEKLKFFKDLKNVGDVRQKGMMIGIELVTDKEQKTPYAWEEKIGIKVCQEARRNGVILRPLGNVIVLMPPLSISVREMGYLLKVTYEAIKTVTGDTTVSFKAGEPKEAVPVPEKKQHSGRHRPHHRRNIHRK